MMSFLTFMAECYILLVGGVAMVLTTMALFILAKVALCSWYRLLKEKLDIKQEFDWE